MENISLTINGARLGFGHAWVHMQGIDGKENAAYCVTIPKPCYLEVFDPHKTKRSDSSWKEFVIGQVDAVGTFILGAYFENMAKIAKDRAKGYQWVIATLDDVVEYEETIELHGKAVIFDPNRV